MRIVAEKTKPILLLLGLSTISLSFIWITNQFKSTDKYYSPNTNTQEEYLIQDTTSVLENAEGVTPEEVVPEDTSQVLAAADNSSKQCKEALVKYKTESMCERTGSKKLDYKDGTRTGVLVSKDARVVLSEVTIPLILLSGSEGVPDSNRQITDETPNVYKPAGEQFDERIANNQLPPGTSIQEKKPWTFKEAFSTFFSTMFGQKRDTPTDEGELVVEEYIQNDCEHCNNDSNVNPDKSNKIASFKLDTTRYPGEKEELKQDSSKVSESCSNQDKFVDLTSKNYTACKISTIGRITALLKAQFTDKLWNNCHDTIDENGQTVPATEECTNVENIVVKISSMFGSDEDCTDDTCTNAYMNKRNASVMAPSDLENDGKTYFTTPCTAIIEGVVGEVNVKCAWDLDYLLKERDFNEYDDYVGNGTPSESAYIKFLMEDSEQRSGEETPIPM